MMKNLLFLLLTALIFNSCAIVYGTNTEKLAQKLELGMTKQEAINIMGKDYYVESASQVAEGKLEILHFYSVYYQPYLLYFLNNKLSEFHRFVPNSMQQDMYIMREDFE